MSKRILIIGGVAGGATAAARIRRLDENAEIIMIERGTDVSFANCGLPYHIGGEISARQALIVQSKEALAKRFRLDIRTRTEARHIDRSQKTVLLRDLETEREYVERYDTLLLSPGAAPLVPPIPGAGDVEFFTLRSLTDMDRINVRIAAGAKSALVVGAGYIGVELAENLRKRGLDVTMVDLAAQVMPIFDPEIAARLAESLQAGGVKLILRTQVARLSRDGVRVAAELSTGATLTADMLVFAIGVKPETGLAAEAGLSLSPQGALIVDEHLRTSDPAIYAVGDAIQIRDFVSGAPAHVPLAGPANRQARIAADTICGRESRYRGAQGTSMVRVFSLNAGMTGASEKRLLQQGRSYRKVYIHRPHHVTYFPGAQSLTLKLLFDPQSERVLGAQAVGGNGVDKRIDVLATAIRAGMSLRDLQELELAYAPPFGAAKDPINIAADAAAHLLDGDDDFVESEEILRNPEGWTVVDVREPEEFAAGHLPDALHIPLGTLRERAHEIRTEKPIAVYCAVGQRAYYASRILRQKGVPVRNLNGGYTTFRLFSKIEKDGAAAAPSPSAGAALLSVQPQPARPAPTALNCCGTAIGDSGRAEAVQQLDLRGLQCPGPLAALTQTARSVPAGTSISAVASDPGFAADVRAWCEKGGHTLRGVEQRGADYVASITLGGTTAQAPGGAPVVLTDKTFVVFSGDLDRVLAAFVIANAAADMGDQVTLFFTFWGLNALRRKPQKPVQKSLLDAMFGAMMPRGAARLKLSKMNMGGMGTALMRKVMRDKNVDDLPTMIANARKKGVRIVVCTMSMNVMGLHAEELLEGVEFGGAAAYLASASKSGVNLFI